MPILTDDATTIEIKGATYAVEAIPAGECGTSAVRVTKLVNGEVYDVIRTRENVVECSCPDFIARHQGKGTTCKHGSAMVARGFLPAVEAPRPARVEVAPITKKDLTRASYFGLKLPAAPIVAEAKVEPIVEAPGVVVEPVAEPIRFARPEHFTDAPVGMTWVAVSPAVGVLRPSPREVEPIVEANRFTPSAEEEMENLGYGLGRDGEEALAPAGRTFPELVAFYGGWIAGKAGLEAEFNEWLDRVEADREMMDAMFGGPEVTWHPAELAECGLRSGHPSYEG